MKMFLLKRSFACSLVFTTLVFNSCKQAIEIDLPIDKTTSGAVFSRSSTAILALSGVYASMGNIGEGSLVGIQGPSLQCGQLGDELKPPIVANDSRIYLNTLTSREDLIWNSCYRILLYRINSVLEGVSSSAGIPDDVKNILVGEAKFTRAFIYFYLVNLYGGVPLVTSTDFKVNSNIPRSTVEEVYSQILADLTDAKKKLPNSYLGADLNSSSNQRIRPTKAAASAMLARIYLYKGMWKDAEDEASNVINNTGLYSLESLSNVFKMNSKETIWALQPGITEEGSNTPDQRIFITSYIFPNLILNQNLLASFEEDDARKKNWITTVVDGGIEYEIPYKYKIGWGEASQAQAEYTVVLRLSEQLLIRAEARARLSNIDGALDDLFQVRNRAGLDRLSGSDQTELINDILHERQVELFCEWGHRWFDLKRTTRIDDVMKFVSTSKVSEDGSVRANWLPYKALMPIPADELIYNRALSGTQNQGY